MADDFIQVNPDGAGKRLDNDSLTVGGNLVYRQRVVTASPTNAAGLAEVINGPPTTEYGLAVWGHLRFTKPTTSELSEAAVSAGTSGDNTLIAGVASKTIRVYRLFLVANGSVQVVIKDGASISLTGGMQLSTSTIINLPLDGEPWFTTSSGNAFVVNLSAAIFVCGRVYYLQS
jgi:hypothetical protein